MITAICLMFVLYLVDFRAVAGTLLSVRPSTLAYGTLLILASVALTLVRFRVVMSNFGFRPSWRDTFVAFSFGQASNLTFLNVVGQSISRAAVLSRANVPAGVSVVVTYWERGLAAAILFMSSLAGGWFLLANSNLEIEIAFSYLFYVSGSVLLVAAIVAVAILGRTATLDRALYWAVRAVRMWPSVVLTLLSQLCMLLAYLVVLIQIAGIPLSLAVVSAIAVIMFASSLPISISGWGVRELSAVQLLGAIGVGSSFSVTAAITIGLITLGVLVLFTVLAMWFFARRPVAATAAADAAGTKAGSEWTSLITLLVAVATSVLIFFQVRVAIDGAELTANISDVVALTALGVTAMLVLQQRSYALFPTGFSVGLTALSLLFSVALIIGWSRYGLNQWAVVNRGLGWIIILGYLSAGGALVWAVKANARVLVLACFALTGATVASLDLLLLAISLFNVSFPPDTFTIPLRGYAGNSNAFALQMIMTAIAAVTAHRIDPGLVNRKLLRFVLVVAALASFYSLSRSGTLTFLGALFLIVLVSARAERRERLIDALFAFAAMLAALVSPEIVSSITALSAGTGVPISVNQNVVAHMDLNLVRAHSDYERWQSIFDGWHLWQQYPLFGAGLGAFVQARIDAGLPSLIIHSIPVWFLAELGLAGLLVVAIAFVGLLKLSVRLLRDREHHAWGAGLVVLLAVLAVSGSVHDFFFQRVFWFLLGIFVGVCGKPAFKHLSERAHAHQCDPRSTGLGGTQVPAIPRGRI